MDLGLAEILTFTRDPGDRNRTSPFAFTGNRFEFRAVGSSQSVSGPLVAMNAMMADSLNWIAGKLEAALNSGLDQGSAVIAVLKELMDAHGNVLFGGDGYSSEWHKKAVEERGLKNNPTSAEALPALLEQSVQDLFKNTGVLSPVELQSRYEVYSEQYLLSIELEAKLTMDIATTSIYPAAMTYLSELCASISGAAAMGIGLDNAVAKKVAAEADAMMQTVAALAAAPGKHDFASIEAHMQYCAHEIRPLMDKVRSHGDSLEMTVSDAAWPLPKYSEMLFIR
jgi:glutamine synthetase